MHSGRYRKEEEMQNMRTVYPSSNNNNNPTLNIKDKMRSCTTAFLNSPCAWVLLAIGVLLIIILVPLSFVPVEYNEYAFKMDTFTKTVDWTQSYTNGNHFLGLKYDGFKFDRAAERVELSDTSVIPSSGLEFFVDIVFYYRLDRKTIPLVFRNFGYNYNDQVVRIALGVIKNKTPQYAFEQFFNNRKLISDQIGEALRKTLADNNFILLPNSFFMQDMRFTNSVVSKYLQTAIQNQDYAASVYIKEQNYIQLETDYMVSLYNNNASYVNQTTTTAINTMINNANYEAFNMKESAKGSGLRYFLNMINVTKIDNINTIIRQMAYLEKHPQIIQSGLNVFINK